MSNYHDHANLCACGCREYTDTKYVFGHQGRVHLFVKLQNFTPEDHGFDGECWIWGGAVDRDDYGKTTHHNRSCRAHRLMYEFMVGAIRPGDHIDHLCSVRRCINPAHLEAVTPLENHRRSSLAKLTPADAREIRSATGTQREIAERFGVSQSTVGFILRGKTWRTA